MTVTKRNLMAALAGVDDNTTILIDNGIDSMECRHVTVVRSSSADNPEVSHREDGTPVEAGAIVLRLAN